MAALAGPVLVARSHCLKWEISAPAGGSLSEKMRENQRFTPLAHSAKNRIGKPGFLSDSLNALTTAQLRQGPALPGVQGGQQNPQRAPSLDLPLLTAGL